MCISHGKIKDNEEVDQTGYRGTRHVGDYFLETILCL